MNRRKQIRRRESERKLNKIIRHMCCWNCFQVGHKRFQCPYPTSRSCSFCRRPQVLTVECGCEASREHLGIPENQEPPNIEIPNYNPDVVVPVLNGGQVAKYEEVDNLVVFVENQAMDDNDLDTLELHAESDNLEDL